MYSGPRHTDSGEAMAHNRMVEQAREAENLRRCAESPAYKRVYERWQAVNRKLLGISAAQQQALNDNMRSQTVQPLSDSIKSQPIRIGNRPDPIPSPDDLRHLAACGNPWVPFLLGMMFADGEKLKQMREDAAATQEMMEVNDRYDRQMIRMSGFEW